MSWSPSNWIKNKEQIENDIKKYLNTYNLIALKLNSAYIDFLNKSTDDTTENTIKTNLNAFYKEFNQIIGVQIEVVEKEVKKNNFLLKLYEAKQINGLPNFIKNSTNDINLYKIDTSKVAKDNATDKIQELTNTNTDLNKDLTKLKKTQEHVNEVILASNPGDEIELTAMGTKLGSADGLDDTNSHKPTKKEDHIANEAIRRRNTFSAQEKRKENRNRNQSFTPSKNINENPRIVQQEIINNRTQLVKPPENIDKNALDIPGEINQRDNNNVSFNSVTNNQLGGKDDNLIQALTKLNTYLNASIPLIKSTEILEEDADAAAAARDAAAVAAAAEKAARASVTGTGEQINVTELSSAPTLETINNANLQTAIQKSLNDTGTCDISPENLKKVLTDSYSQIIQYLYLTKKLLEKNPNEKLQKKIDAALKALEITDGDQTDLGIDVGKITNLTEAKVSTIAEILFSLLGMGVITTTLGGRKTRKRGKGGKRRRRQSAKRLKYRIQLYSKGKDKK